MTLVAGVDFGTAGVRVAIVDRQRGRLGSGVASYPTQRRADDPDFATQRHADHLQALIEALRQAVVAANIDGRQVAALAIATTGSTMVLVDANLEPLADYYLWCDHRAWREAAEITAAARRDGWQALDYCGGEYLAEFGLAKLLHWLRNNPEARSRFATALEQCDMLAATLCGITDPRDLPRSVCAMGHKWMWNESLGGLPGEDFLSRVDPLFAGVRGRLGGRYGRSNQLAGSLCRVWAERLGLSPGIPIPCGGLDAHWDAIGAGIRLGDIVNVIGTSTCVMAIAGRPDPLPGVCGVVHGSIHPAYAGIEAGLSAVGDLFDAIARRANTTTAELFNLIAGYRSGQTGLLRLVWDNGDRTVLGDPRLRGATLGWNLAHTAADELFAALEGTAFHTRIIIEQLRQYGVKVDRIINTGGIARRSQVLNRVYANALGTPVLVPQGDTTCLGAAIFALLAAGACGTVEEAQRQVCPEYVAIEPEPCGRAVCDELYGWFHTLYRSLGREHSAPVSLGGLFSTLQKLARF